MASSGEFSVLSDKKILEFLKEERIVIEPFDEGNLNTSSYDVTLGDTYYRETRPKNANRLNIFNIYSKEDVSRVWGKPKRAATLKELNKNQPLLPKELENVKPTDKVIWISPGETILCHTKEQIGGRGSITSKMSARSSSMRAFISVCQCAGWGDAGFYTIWTMEVTNHSRYYHIPLVVGHRFAQITFFQMSELRDKDYVEQGGKYQSHSIDNCEPLQESLSRMRASWKPEMMLPRRHLDREITEKE